MAPKTSTFFDLKTCLGKSYRHSRPPPHTMCPTAFLAPTLTAKTCFICTQAHLRCKVMQMGKSRYLVEFPAQKKEPKWFQILGRFKKNSSCSVAKKSPKNWTGPCLSLNWSAKKVQSGAIAKWKNPTPPSPMQQWRPPARTDRYSRPPPHTMCPTAFLAPTLTAKTCFICTQPQNAFFLAQLALQGNRANGKKSLPGRVPGPKKGTKMVPNSGSFQEEFFLLSGQKKSQKLDRALP